MTMSPITPIAFAALLAAAGAAAAQDYRAYRGDDAEEVGALAHVQISLVDAIAAAENETSGKALEATLEVEDGRTFYEVDVFAGNVVKHVHVDAAKGSVLEVRDDRD